MKKEIVELIIEKASSLGFSLISFSGANIPEDSIIAYENWLKKNYHADLSYMENSSPRRDLSELLKNAKSVISLAVNYKKKVPTLEKESLKVAQYAYGRDYHKFIKKRLKLLEAFIKMLIPEINTRSFVDACPVLERSYAKEAGLGFIGKNSCLITKQFGSFVFLSEIICDIEFPKTNKKNINQNKGFSICGSCQLCMNACPTKAIVSPGVIDANRCIAYHTIENKNEIPEEIKHKIKESSYLFGCDICQSVCPHNALTPCSEDSEIMKKIAGSSLKISDLKNLKTEEGFLEKFKGSPLMRAKLKGIKRILKLHT